MRKTSILWADDEIDLLKPHIIFLEEKGFEVFTTNSGNQALDMINLRHFDIIFLDENMPGLSGLKTLLKIKAKQPNIPVVMITKSEEENVMEEAIGSNIADYLIKPVNPNQILLCIKKNIDNKELISKKTVTEYQQEFRNIGMSLGNNLSFKEWADIYRKIVHWDIELEKSKDESMSEILNMQKTEANVLFSKFIENNYIDWVSGKAANKPILSHTLVKEKVFPLLTNSKKPAFLIIIDNLRYDQWKDIQPVLEEYFIVKDDDIYLSILPSATHYSRNAIFAGLMPSEIEKKYPQLWLNESDDGTKNQYEKELFHEQLKRFGKDIKFSYNKVLNMEYGKKLAETMANYMSNDLNIIVYNFVDMLSHARTEMDVIRELADDETAYRSLTVSWFEHSPLLNIIKFIAENGANIVLTTDHGSIRVKNPVKVIGDKETSTNLRYKCGRNLNYERKEVFEIKDPTKAYLPKTNVSSNYIFCRNNDFFTYPNNYNYYVSYYMNTFQHGGVSMEEMLIPVVILEAK